MIYEVAEGLVTKRHILKSEEELPDWSWENGKKQALYQSVYCYSPKDRDDMEKLKTVQWADKQRFIQWVPIDIDKGDSSDEDTIRRAAAIVYNLRELGLHPYNMKCYFSGTGYHIMIHEGCFNFRTVLKEKGIINGEPFLDFPYVVKETMRKLPEIGDNIDPAIYQRNGFIRSTYSLNQKSGLYKIPVTQEEILLMKWEEIHELAKTRREDFPWEDEYVGNGELEKYVVTFIPSVRAYTAVREPMFEEHCIYKMLSDGPKEGSRNNVVLRLASHFKKSGIPSDNAKALILDWNNMSLDENIVLEKIESAYNRNYNYGCNDSLRLKYCSPRCKHYESKDVIETPQSFEELVESTRKIDFLKELEVGVDIAKPLHLNMYDSDFIALRGEVVAIIGMTKAGKSTFMKHIALGLDFVDMNIIHEENKRGTVYYTGEEAPEYFLMNCCKILENCGKHYMLHHQQELLDKWLKDVNHIMPLPTQGKLSRIEEDIEKFKPEQIMLDTLDHFVDKKKGSAGIEEAMLYVQEVAVKYNVIIWLVSQVNRMDSRDGIVTLFSGKGSGSIENQARKVIGISTTDVIRKSHLEFLANSTGDCGQECDFQILSSSRIKKV